MVMRDDEPLRIGVIVAPSTTRRLIRMCCGVEWLRYSSLEECARWREQDELEALVVELSYVEQDVKPWWALWPKRRRPAGSALLEMLSRYCPVIVMAPAARAFPLWEDLPQVSVLIEPVAASMLAAALANHRERIQRRRLDRLFRQVAEAYAIDTRA